MLFSMSIIVAAMMPIFTLERVEGRIFRPVALTYAFALVGALFFTMTTRAGADRGAAQAGEASRSTSPKFLVLLRASTWRRCGSRCATRARRPLVGLR